MTKLKFCEMPCGTHFQDGSGRKFIKLRINTAAGVPQKHIRRIQKSEYGPESDLPFNSVDYEGCAASCRDWSEFNILKIEK